jgi:hypothetical protein
MHHPQAEEPARRARPESEPDAVPSPLRSPLSLLARGVSNAEVARLMVARRSAVLARDDATGDDAQAADQPDAAGGDPPPAPEFAVPDGAAVLEAPADAAPADPGDATLQRSALSQDGRPRLLRDVDPAGATLGGIGFLQSLKGQDLGSLNVTNTEFRFTGTKKGAAQPVDKQYSILLVDSRKSLGGAWAWFSLFLRFDGANILHAYTRVWSSNGYAGGLLGSDAQVTFNAAEAGGAEDDLKSAIITCNGTNNPNGPGFMQFFAQFTAYGNGAVSIDTCDVVSGSGIVSKSPYAYAGFKAEAAHL